jgi:hypothetical protein
MAGKQIRAWHWLFISVVLLFVPGIVWFSFLESYLDSSVDAATFTICLGLTFLGGITCSIITLGKWLRRKHELEKGGINPSTFD